MESNAAQSRAAFLRLHTVIAGLDPAIHLPEQQSSFAMDAWVTPAHGEREATAGDRVA